MKNKVIAVFFAAVMAVVSMATTAFAAENTESIPELESFEMIVENEDGTETVHDLMKEVKYMVDKDGTITITPRANFTQHTINSKSTMYYTNDGNGHKLNRNQQVRFKATFDRPLAWEAGYERNGSKTKVTSGNYVATFDTYVYMPADGTYNFYITNESSSAVTVKSGAITY